MFFLSCKPNLLLLLQSLLEHPAEGTPSYEPQKHGASTSIMSCCAGVIKTKVLPTFSIFQMPLFLPKAHKKAVLMLVSNYVKVRNTPCLSTQSSFPCWKLGWKNMHFSHSQMRSPYPVSGVAAPTQIFLSTTGHSTPQCAPKQAQLSKKNPADLQHEDLHLHPAIRVNWCWRATPHRISNSIKKANPE